MRIIFNGVSPSESERVRKIEEGGVGGRDAQASTIALGGIPLNRLGVPGGVASKDETNRIPLDQIPANFKNISDIVTVDGVDSILKNSTTTYTITNFDVSTNYTVTPIRGAVSRNGSEIIYSAPASAGEGGFIINDVRYVVRIFEPTIDKPIITTPTHTSLNRDIKVVFTSTNFSVSGGTGAHQASTWQISTDEYFTEIFDQSVKDPLNKTSWVNSINFKPSTEYFVRVRYTDAIIGNSQWSNVVKFKTKSLFLPNQEEAKINPVNQELTDYYGYVFEVSDDGNTLLASSEFGSSDNRVQAGKVHVFTRVTGVWVYVTTLSASNKSDGYKFGTSITLNDAADSLVIGSRGFSGNGLGNSGAVYPFYKNKVTGEWVQQPTLLPTDRHVNARFSIATLSGDGKTLAVAAYTQDSTPNVSTGVVYIFDKTETYWTQSAVVPITGANSDDKFGQFGVKLSYDGKVLVCSSPAHTVSGQAYAGAVAIFGRTNTGWVQDTLLENPLPVASGLFGSSFSLNALGNKLVVGAPGNRNTSNVEVGAVYVYQKANGVWSIANTIQPDSLLPGDAFGSSVSISKQDECIVVGAPNRPMLGISESGGVFVFSKDGVNYTLASELFSSTPNARNGFGHRVLLSADTKTLIVGSYGKNYLDNQELGSLYVFV